MKHHPKGVLLSGYYGFGNVGDETILEAAILAFQQHNIPVNVLSHTPEKTAAQFNVTAYNRGSLKEIIRAILNARLILSGGGGLFQDITSVRSLVYYLRIPFIAKLLGRKTMIFAQGIGPINTPRGKQLMGLTLNWMFDKMTVRDQDSRELLQQLGAKREIEVTADLAFLFPLPSPQNYLTSIPNGMSPFGVVLRDWPNLESTLDAWGKALSRFAEQNKLYPVLFSFQHELDQSIMDSLHQQLNVPHLLIQETLSPRELLVLTSGLDFVIGMRYHSIVFASKCGVPFIGIAYDPKVSNFSKQMELPTLSLENASIEKLTQSFADFYENKSHYQQLLKSKVPTLIEKAERNIDVALHLL